MRLGSGPPRAPGPSRAAPAGAGPRALGLFISRDSEALSLLRRVGWSSDTAFEHGIGAEADHQWEHILKRLRAGDFDAILADPHLESFVGVSAGCRERWGPFGLPPRSAQDLPSQEVYHDNYILSKVAELFRVAVLLGVSVVVWAPVLVGPSAPVAFPPIADLRGVPGSVAGFAARGLRAESGRPAPFISWGFPHLEAPDSGPHLLHFVKGLVARGRRTLPPFVPALGGSGWRPEAPVRPQLFVPDELPGDLATIVDVDRPTPLRGVEPAGARALRRQEDALAVGGMRNPGHAVSKLPLLRATLSALRPILLKAVTQDLRISGVVSSILEGSRVEGLPADVVAHVRAGVAQALGVEASQGPGLQPALFEGLALAGDPDHHLHHWLREGAPLGVLHPVESAGIFPPTPCVQASPEQLAGLVTDYHQWENYRSAEEDPSIAEGLLQRMVDRGWAQAFDSYGAAQAELGSQDLVFNKLALVTRVKPDGSVKHRLVWDLLRSGVNGAVSQGERVVLPRLYDLVRDARALAQDHPDPAGDRTQVLLGIDIEDAFHQIPLRGDEQRFTLASIAGRIYVFRVIVFGSGSAPTVWGRFSALLGRTIAGVTDSRVLRLQIYVDDPVFVARGAQASIHQELAVALLWTAVLGYPVSWGKADGGSQLRWIGADVVHRPGELVIEVPEDRAQALLEDIREMGRRSAVSRRAVQQLAGRLNFFAGLIPVMRPFLATLWAAIAGSADEASGPGPSSGGAEARADRAARGGLVHVRRFRHGLRWFEAFFAGRRGSLRREFPLGRTRPVPAVAVVDASPWGIGGVLFLDGRPAQRFSDGITDADLAVFSAARGESAHNTTWEGLALVVALRLWGPCSGGWRVGLRSDSLGALMATSRLRSRSPGLSLIVAEIALMVAEWGLCLGSASHIPGAANTQADALSRLLAPEPSAVPPELASVPRAVVPVRPRGFWHALAFGNWD